MNLIFYIIHAHYGSHSGFNFDKFYHTEEYNRFPYDPGFSFTRFSKEALQSHVCFMTFLCQRIQSMFILTCNVHKSFINKVIIKHLLLQELLETEIRLKNGGLGGVPDFDTWDARLETATEISDMVISNNELSQIF